MNNDFTMYFNNYIQQHEAMKEKLIRLMLRIGFMVILIL